MAENFTELIYKSTDRRAGIASGEVDRLLGIRKLDGTAVVVDIDGVNGVLTKSALRPVVENPGDDDVVVYSKKGADDRFFLKDNVETDDRVTPSDDMVFSGLAVKNLIDRNTDGSKWEPIDSTSSIRPKAGKAVVIGSQGTNALALTVYGRAQVTGASELKGNTTIGTQNGTNATLTVYGRAQVTGASELDGDTTIGTQNGTPVTLTVNGSIAMPTKTLSYDANTGFSFNDKCTATAFYESSDIALKKNVAPVGEDAISKAANVRLVEFDWKDGGKHSYGVIAQEVETLMPELVTKDEHGDGMRKVNYIALLCAKVAALESHVTDLEKEIANLKQKQQ